MNTNRLYEILDACCTSYRKDEPVIERTVAGGLQVVEIFDMAHADEVPPDDAKVDVHFMVIGVERAKADEHRAELVEILNGWEDPYSGAGPERLRAGPSYIEIGAAIGSQDYALRLFALGDVLGLWKVVTPERFGFAGAEADRVAGGGFVMMSGFAPEAAEPAQ